MTLICSWDRSSVGRMSAMIDCFLTYTGTHGVFRFNIGPKPTTQRNVRIELVVSGWKELGPQHHTYDGHQETLNDGYNLIEGKARLRG